MIRFDRHTCLAKACETDVAEFVASRMPEAPEPWRSADLVRAALRGRIAGARNHQHCIRLEPPLLRTTSSESVHEAEHDRDRHHRRRKPSQLTGGPEA